MRMMATAVAHRTYVMVFGKEDPNDGEWAEHLELLSRSRDALGVLAWSYGGTPNVSQRASAVKLLTEMFGEGSSAKTAVLTDSLAMRGVVTVANWFWNGATKPFPVEDVDGALRFLAVTDPARRQGVLQTLEQCKRAVGFGRARVVR